MKKKLSVAILALLMVSLVGAGCVAVGVIELPESPNPAPPKEWSRTFGGPDWDEAHSVQQTACGGFIIAGDTEGDFWLLKLTPER